MYENSSAALAAYADRISKLAQEVEVEDPIDWGMLSISEENAYALISANVVDKFDKYNSSERDIMLATIVKLVIENFVLNLKLKNRD